MTTAIAVADFLQFAQGATPRGNYHQMIAVYLATLAQCSDAANIERVTLDQVAKINEKYPAPNTAKQATAAHRKAIGLWAATITLDESNSIDASAMGKAVQSYATGGRVHRAIPPMNIGREKIAAVNAEYRDHREVQRRDTRPINVFAAIAAAEQALTSTDPWEVAAAFTFLTGRRPIEVTRRVGFSLVGRHIIEFAGQAKRKGAEAEQPSYKIYSLCESYKIIDAITAMNRAPDFKEIDSIESNEQAGFKIHPKAGRRARAVFGDLIPPAAGRDQLTPSGLRSAYVVAAAALFRGQGVSLSAFAQDVLGHLNTDESLSYEDYYAVGADGVELPSGLWVDRLLEAPATPATKAKSSVTLSAATRERLAATVPGEKQDERINAAIDAYLENTSLRRKVAALESRLAKASPEPSPAPAATAQPSPAGDKSSRIIYRDMASDELKAAKGPGSAGEKLKRAMAAIIEWNQGREPAAMYKLSAANLRKISTARHTAVVEWMQQNAGEIDAYNNAHGLTGGQHDRGKQPIEQVIGW